MVKVFRYEKKIYKVRSGDREYLAVLLPELAKVHYRPGEKVWVVYDFDRAEVKILKREVK